MRLPELNLSLVRRSIIFTDDQITMNLVRLRRCGNINCSSQQQLIDTRTASTRSVYQVNANTLCELIKRIQTKRLSKSFGQLLCLASILPSENDRPCSVQSCGYPERVVFVLNNLPDLVSIAINWNSFECTSSDVEDLLTTIDPLIHLRELFYDVTLPDARHQQLHLIGLVCFYGGTIEVFFSYDHKTCKWHFCFDGNVLVSADWNAVMRKCMEFHLQPFLLIYANPSRNSVDISQLLKQTVIQAKQTNRIDPRRSDTDKVSNCSKTTMLKKQPEYVHSIENLEKISSFANLNSSMLFLPKSTYINEETVAKVMHQQISKKEILSDSTSMPTSTYNSPLVHIRNRSHLWTNYQQQLHEDASSSGDSSASSQRDSGLSSGINDESSDGSPRDSLVEQETNMIDTLIKQTQSLQTDDQLEITYASIEHEIENSLKLESASDFGTALICCERALILVEQLLNQSQDNGISIYARTKKNSLLLRIRSLRKRQNEQDEQTSRTSFTSTFKPAEKLRKSSENIYDNNVPRSPSSILSSTTKLARPKKNVKFSDHVALIVPTRDDVEEGPSEHLIHSFLRKIHQQPTGSDSDSDTPSLSNDLPIGLTECTLCHKRCSKTHLIGNYCSNCHFYMQRFQPTAS